MTVIRCATLINAPKERIFDLARSIDAHRASAEGTSEKVVDGIRSGLMALGEEVTWEARHLGVVQQLRVKMTKLDRPHHFQDTMMRGAFAHMVHDHEFIEQDGQVLMTDRFEFSAPLGFLGKMAETLFLEAYMRRFLEKRNHHLKAMAESDEWKLYLK